MFKSMIRSHRLKAIRMNMNKMYILKILLSLLIILKDKAQQNYKFVQLQQKYWYNLNSENLQVETKTLK